MKGDRLYTGESDGRRGTVHNGQRLDCGGRAVSLGRLDGALGDRNLERTGRARYAGPTFVVDFIRLLELLHDAPDKVGISEAGVRQEERGLLAGTSSHRGPAGRRGLARPGCRILPVTDWKMESSWFKEGCCGKPKM